MIYMISLNLEQFLSGIYKILEASKLLLHVFWYIY